MVLHQFFMHIRENAIMQNRQPAIAGQRSLFAKTQKPSGPENLFKNRK